MHARRQSNLDLPCRYVEAGGELIACGLRREAIEQVDLLQQVQAALGDPPSRRLLHGCEMQDGGGGRVGLSTSRPLEQPPMTS